LQFRGSVEAAVCGRGSPRWTAAARLEAVIVTAATDEATRSASCREQGLYYGHGGVLQPDRTVQQRGHQLVGHLGIAVGEGDRDLLV
jgi:hypothetical protein